MKSRTQTVTTILYLFDSIAKFRKKLSTNCITVDEMCFGFFFSYGVERQKIQRCRKMKANRSTSVRVCVFARHIGCNGAILLHVSKWAIKISANHLPSLVFFLPISFSLSFVHCSVLLLNSLKFTSFEFLLL